MPAARCGETVNVFALNDRLSRDFGMRLPLAQFKSVEQPAKFAAGDGERSFMAVWPLERPAFETAIKQPEPVVFPIQDLELVALTVAKHEQARRERVKAEAFLNERGQRVDGLAQIGRPASQINALDSGWR